MRVPRMSRNGGSEAPFAQNTLVPYGGKVVRILFRAWDEHRRPTYTLCDRHNAQRNVAANVPHAQLIDEMAAYARYAVTDTVALAHTALMTIYKRQWDFRTGTVWYYFAHPNRNVAVGWLNQERVMQLDRSLDPVLGS